MKTIALIRSYFGRVQQSGWFNKYTISLAIFFIWMLFFDKHNLIVQYRLSHNLKKLERQIEQDQALLQEALLEK